MATCQAETAKAQDEILDESACASDDDLFVNTNRMVDDEEDYSSSS